MIDTRDDDAAVERWFVCNAAIVADTSARELRMVACYIPIVGVPANDRVGADNPSTSQRSSNGVGLAKSHARFPLN